MRRKHNIQKNFKKANLQKETADRHCSLLFLETGKNHEAVFIEFCSTDFLFVRVLLAVDYKDFTKKSD